ncbi:MAG: hypothetical protein FJ202_08655 [Gemmatimonadetes bacterium]|nr:hypothetical protein [Gemmatimonadota bacterium]
MNWLRLEQAFRIAALIIAVAALVDPELIRTRADGALVSVVARDATADSVLLKDVRARLSAEFTIIAEPSDAARATVVVGAGAPLGFERAGGPVFRVVADLGADDARIRDMDVEPEIGPGGSANVRITWIEPERTSAPVRIALRSGGVLVASQDGGAVLPEGDALEVAMRSARPSAGVVTRTATLAVVPPDTGLIRLTVELERGNRVVAAAGTYTRVTARAIPVLVYDARPSWMSRFVRRALESSPTLDLASRVNTSRAASSDAGTARSLPRTSLAGDPAALDRYAVIVVGGADALGTGDVAALDRFMRRRGGSVVMVLDSVVSGPANRLTGVVDWRVDRRRDTTSLALTADRAAPALRATALAAPRALPPGGTPLGPARASSATLWDSPVGRGRLIVTGALDAWQFREVDGPDWADVWIDIVTGAAASARRVGELQVEPQYIHVGGDVEVHYAMEQEDAADAPAWAVLSTGDSIALTSGQRPGSRFGRFRAPASVGAYSIGVQRNAGAGRLTVVDRRRVAEGSGGPAVQMLAAATGGGEVSAGQLRDLPGRIRDAHGDAGRPRPVYPMRSPWWIVPFTLLLAVEWWLRRNRGAR